MIITYLVRLTTIDLETFEFTLNESNPKTAIREAVRRLYDHENIEPLKKAEVVKVTTGEIVFEEIA
jgi:glucan phosphorylase